MHQRAVVCSMCGGKFFPASLAFHQKACARKQNFVLVPCPYCDVEVPKPELNTHVTSVCKKAPKSAQPAKGGTAAPGVASASAGPLGADAPENPLFDEAGRMCCPVCNRWFSQDRIGTHQAICKKLEARKKRPIFDSFQQRKFDPLIHRSDIEKKQAQALGSGAATSNALKAARSYYTPERVQQTEGGQKPYFARKGSVSQASEKSKTRSGDAEVVPEKTKPSMGRAPRTRSTQSRINQSPCNEEHVASITSRPTTFAGERRATGMSTSEARKRAANNSAVPARSEGADSKKGVSQLKNERNNSRLSTQHQSICSMPPSMRDTLKPCNPRTERSGVFRGGGAILQTNEASIGNTLAYPNYPATWNERTDKQEPVHPSYATTSSAYPNRTHQGLHMSGRGTHAGGEILPTNQASADNPLAFP